MGIESHASRRRFTFPLFVLVLQIVFIIVFAFESDYADEASGRKDYVERVFEKRYPMFMDVQVMIFIGFGFLMTFLRRYGYSAVCFNFLIAAMVAQWSLIVKGLLHWNDLSDEDKEDHVPIQFSIDKLIQANFAAAVVLISFGAVLGKLEPTQLLFMGLVETVLAAVNEHYCFSLFKIVDIGGSMMIHAFGAYFGIAVTSAIYKHHHRDDPREGSVYHSDIFAMIGTVFLWICWPSFNGALANGDDQHRAVINTFLSLCGCVLATFAFSALTDKRAKLDMVHVQNASIAGGVAIGAVADLFVKPYGAVLIGAVSGGLSVLGYRYLTPLLSSKARIHDTCGVNNLHGMPGILSAIASAVLASLASYEVYGNSLYTFFPGVLAHQNPKMFDRLHGTYANGTSVASEYSRSPGDQAGYQLAALGMTLGISILGGFFTGIILRLPVWCAPTEEEVFDDDPLWGLPDDLPSTYTYVTTKEHLPSGAEKFVISEEQWKALHTENSVC